MDDQQAPAPQDQPAGQPPHPGAPPPQDTPQDTPRPPYGAPAQPGYGQTAHPLPPGYGQHPGYGPQPGYGRPPVPYSGGGPISPSDARMWSILAHVGGTFLSFLVPLVIFLVFKDRDLFVRRYSAAALNFHITLAIAYIVLAITVIGLLVIPFLWVASLVFTILASIAASDGRDYQYPMSLKLVH
jgi:uncharacterized Tic20 family protein